MIFVSDYGYRITFAVDHALPSQATVSIAYVSPSKGTGEFPASISILPDRTLVSLDVGETLLTEAGLWYLRVIVTDNTSYRYSSDAVAVYAIEPILEAQIAQSAQPTSPIKEVMLYVNIHDQIEHGATRINELLKNTSINVSVDVGVNL